MTENKEESLERYLEGKRRQLEAHRPSIIQTPEEPKVEKKEKVFPFPHNVWDNEQYGSIYELIEYVRQTNRVPHNASVEVQLEDLSQQFTVRFFWWEIRYLDPESGRC